MRYAAAFVMLLLSCAVGLAQTSRLPQAPVEAPKYAPITLDEKTYYWLMNSLSEFKYKDVMNILSALVQLEQSAQSAESHRANPEVK